jgi:hypothetical protein
MPLNEKPHMDRKICWKCLRNRALNARDHELACRATLHRREAWRKFDIYSRYYGFARSPRCPYELEQFLAVEGRDGSEKT